jgi:4-amino-4-deoxy-L-arabinose transferase-like glycosyltransferase
MTLTGPTTKRDRRLSTALAALLACVALLPLLGRRLLGDWDEGIYAEVAREMLHGSWLVPHWNGHPWFEKPPLDFWLTALAYKLMGVNEFSGRIVSAGAGVALIALLHHWLLGRRDVLTAWLCTLMLLGTFGFLHGCHVGEIDILLSLFECVAVIALAALFAEDEAVTRAWLLFWLAFALAVMAKGAAAVIIPLTALACLSQRVRRKLLHPANALGLLLFLVLTLPWHLVLYHRFGRAFLDSYLGLHVLARALQPIEDHHTHWWFYLMVLLVSAPPFVLFYPGALWRGFRKSELRPWAVFAAVVVVFFTVVQTRLPNYVVPAYPAFTVLASVWIADWLRPHLMEREARTWWLRLGGAFVVVAAISIAATRPLLRSLHTSSGYEGVSFADNKEADELLARRPLPELRESTPSPLLVWRRGPVQSIATLIFYARRDVQQVQPEPLPAGAARNIYRLDPVTFDRAIGLEPRFLLLEKSLLPELPGGLAFTPIRSSPDFELGVVVRRGPARLDP